MPAEHDTSSSSPVIALSIGMQYMLPVVGFVNINVSTADISNICTHLCCAVVQACACHLNATSHRNGVDADLIDSRDTAPTGMKATLETCGNHTTTEWMPRRSSLRLSVSYWSCQQVDESSLRP